MKSILSLICFSLLFATGCTKKEQAAAPSKLMIFTAASLTEVMNEIAATYTQAYGTAIIFNQGSSGTLARQIESGSPADLFISASNQWSTYVDSIGKAPDHDLHAIAYNRLVLIGIAGAASAIIDSSFTTLIDSVEGKFSLGDPEFVPAGKYGKEALTYFGWFDAVKDRIVPAQDVRTALMAVETGNARYGIVFATDAILSSRVSVIGTFPAQSHKPIAYTAVRTSSSDEAKRFFNYLSSETARNLFTKYGFTL